MRPQNPFNAIPIVVALIALTIVGLEMAFWLADNKIISATEAVRWRLDAWTVYSFDPSALHRVLYRDDYSRATLQTFVTYLFISNSIETALFAGALTLALGKFVGDAFGSIQVLALYVISAIVGAVIYALIFPEGARLFGAFPAVFGLIGAYSYVLWMRLRLAGENQLLAFRLIGVLILIQLLFSIVVLLTGQNENGWPVWVAELAGFFTGFVLSVLLAPGGWTAFVDRMRQRS